MSISIENGNNLVLEYAIVLFYSSEDNSWVADVPDLKYCSAFGDTPEEAAKEIQVAIAGWIESARKNGKPIPQPKFDPKHLNFSSKVSMKSGQAEVNETSGRAFA